MRIFILSEIISIHTRRWVTSLCHRGHTVFMFGLLKSDTTPYEGIPNLTIYSCDYSLEDISRKRQWINGKIQYIGGLSAAKRKIKEFQPDILHAHYASSYGLIGALSGFHPFIVSVWGSDVYEYPNAGGLYRRLLRYTFRKADTILSTSHCMADETRKYTDKDISITPFGVDVNRFAPVKSSETPKTSFVIGNVKTLRPVYGIDILIKAFAELCQMAPDRNLLLKIAGTGPQHETLQELCNTLGVSDKVQFLGYIPNEQLPALYSSFDVAVSLSRRESFGVVAVEAMACECPVVTSNADGFKEVVDDGVTGLIVPVEDVHSAAQALYKLLADDSLRTSMGKAGRQRVLRLYDWEKNVDTMEAIYSRYAK